jgi:hypothetical protein
MTPVSAVRAFAICSSAAAMLALSCGGIAHAITDTIFQYKTPKTGYFSISPMAFAPEQAGYVNAFIIDAPASVSPTPEHGICMVAGLNLPDGAQIRSFAAWVSSDLDRGVAFLVFRSNPATGDFTALTQMESDDVTQKRVAMTLPASEGPVLKVNNKHFNYGAMICLQTGNSKFYGGRITYTYTDAGD